MRRARPGIATFWSGSLAEPLRRTSSAPDDRWRWRNPGRILFAAADRFVADKLALVAQGGPAPTPALAVLFEHLDQGGTRPTVLAARTGLAKQSMTELTARAGAMGLVERRADPADARVRVVAFTPAGLLLLQRLRAGVLGAERALAKVVGKPFLRVLKTRLARYCAAGAPSIAPDNPAWRRWSIGRLLRSAARRFAADTLSVVHAHGFGDVNEAILGLCRLLDREGTRLTLLAIRARMTKPAMAELVGRAEAAGLVERRPDPQDGRARAICFTARGLALLDAARDGVAHAERRLAAVTGEPFVAELVERLSAYAAGCSVPRASA